MYYFFKNKKALFCIRLIDQFLSLFPKKKASLSVPKKILLSNMAHLGDLIMATAVLPVLRKAYPEAQIGFVIGSWNREVLESHPLVDKIHFFDHAKLSRSEKTFLKKLWRHMMTRHRTLKEIREEKYDVAIDLYYYFPNAIPLFWQAAIPCRLGYSSGGFGPLLTHSFAYEEKNQYLAVYYLPLLIPLGIPPSILTLLHTTVPPSKAQFNDAVILHMGVGDPEREWEEESWSKLIDLLDVQGIKLLFTGRGEKERERIDRLKNKNGVNLCDALDFSALLSYVKGARLTISSDTGILHVAAAVNTPSIVLFSKQANPYERIQDEAITLKMTLKSTPKEVYEKALSVLNLSM
jgi:ADP-heptose:LPS heptosyltransferase